jgi:hypothetical protein
MYLCMYVKPSESLVGVFVLLKGGGGAGEKEIEISSTSSSSSSGSRLFVSSIYLSYPSVLCVYVCLSYPSILWVCPVSGVRR